MNRKIRVLVVDDSALMRKLIPETLRRDPSIEVVGTAMDGLIGLKRIEELQPDVVTLDLEMPRMDGMEMLRQITRHHRIPVIVFAARSDQGADFALRALSTGAFDIVTKPQAAASGNLEQVADQLASRIKAAVASGAPKMLFPADTKPYASKKAGASIPASRVIGIGVSTGGPAALEYLFSRFSPDFGGCLLVVQHMPEGFTDRFARRLNESSAIEVKEAQSGDILLAGRALICPGDRHLRARRMEHGDVAMLSDAPPVNGHKPSADVLFDALAHEYGTNAVAVLMTGMGEDGVSGMNAVRTAGGVAIAQSPDSCVVDSMPRAAIERRFATRIVHLDRLAGVLETICEVDKTKYRAQKLDRRSLNSEFPAEGVTTRRRSI
jgi:two-component system chemotaxis response regulator CheB